MIITYQSTQYTMDIKAHRRLTQVQKFFFKYRIYYLNILCYQLNQTVNTYSQ